MDTIDEQPVSEAAVLFADICESTRLYTEHGDRVAFEIASRCLDVLSEATQAAGGQPVKRLGDGLLSVFETSAAAIEAAAAMLTSVEATAWGTTPGIRIHIGVSYGRVVVERNDVHGDVVNVASRLAALAQADEIFLSGDAYARLSPDVQASARRIDQMGLRSRPGEVQVYQYLPAGEGADETIRGRTQWQRAEAHLELAYRERVLPVDAKCPRVRLGRDADNDLAVAGTLVSRHHAEISYQHGGFVLRDFSTNGTYVLGEDGSPIARVFRSDRTLTGRGGIVLGAGEGDVIRFRLVE